MDMQTNPDLIRQVVQRNCHISDARHASNYTLCVYLLKMREFYRWEKGHAFTDSVPNDEMGEWLTARESLWETLETAPFAPLPVGGREIDPFETGTINRYLVPEGQVYSGGIGGRGTPHFFLARLETEIQAEGYHIYVSAEEYARDLTAPPAMALGTDIFIRRESIRRMLWEKVQEWRGHRLENAMARALQSFDHDLDGALEEMTNHELDAVIHHEIGEVRAGRLLGEAWERMLCELPHSRAELMVRAVRDLLADTLSTLPRLVETDNRVSLHFYMANLTAMRKDLFPGLTQAYRQWSAGGDWKAISQAAAQGQAHWSSLGEQILDLHARLGAQCHEDIERLVENNRLTG